MFKKDKIFSIIDFGGLNFPIFMMEDKIFKKKSVKQYIYKVLESADPRDYPRLLKDLYHYMTGDRLNLENPKTFNEKVQWMKLHDATPLKTRLVDKYLVREWVKEKIGETYLIPLLGVWDHFDEIDFDSLPSAFALKCNHGSAMNLIVRDKNALDMAVAKRKFDKWLQTNFAYSAGFELQYKDVPPKIIAEQYLEQMDQNLMDYKIHTFHGEPKIVQLIGDRDPAHHRAKEAFFTPEWEPIIPKIHTYDFYDLPPEKPKGFEEMMSIARSLAEGFWYVRVDLYNLDGRILFGEMTFSPASGFGKLGGKNGILTEYMNR